MTQEHPHRGGVEPDTSERPYTADDLASYTAASAKTTGVLVAGYTFGTVRSAASSPGTTTRPAARSGSGAPAAPTAPAWLRCSRSCRQFRFACRLPSLRCQLGAQVAHDPGQ